MVDGRSLRNLATTENVDLDNIVFEQGTRNDIGHAILAHPEQMPSVGEIHYLAGGNHRNIRDHIDRLREDSYLERVEYEEAAQGELSVFYRLTEEGEEKLTDGALKQDKLENYQQTLERREGHPDYTDEQITEYLEAERPE